MLTVQRVSGSLRSGGFKASRTSTTSVRGWSDVSEGFKVRRSWPEDGSVTVYWNLQKSPGYPQDLKRKRQKLADMYNFLLTQGFALAEIDETNLLFQVREKTANGVR